MAKVTILYWKDIPSVVEARDDQGVHKELMSERFQELIDLIAMKLKLAGTDEYLMQWSKGRPYEVSGSARDAAISVKDEFENRYKEIRKEELAKAVG
ncbi:MAG: virulence factor [Acidiferrobacterales bacterium]|nr:virulence factor [Acidiferrobacterales bacterium]